MDISQKFEQITPAMDYLNCGQDVTLGSYAWILAGIGMGAANAAVIGSIFQTVAGYRGSK